MKYPFQELKATNERYAGEFLRVAQEVISSGWYLGGKHSKSFLADLAAATGTDYAIGTGNGLDALRLIFRGYIELGKLAPGDEVIAPANTFIATLLPITELGLRLHLLDPNEETFGLDLAEAEKHVGPKTRAIIVTHLYGTPSWDMAAARRLRERGLLLLEDNAQAIGATFEGRPTGSLGDASALSFYPAKNIGALGDAGAVCTSDADLARTIEALHDYGADRRYHYPLRGYNSRIDELQAAFLHIKLRDLAEVSEHRRRVAHAYDLHIDNPQIIKPKIFTDREQVWHQYVIRTPERDELIRYLEEQGVGTGIHYPIPPHLQPCYAELPLPSRLPLTEAMAAEVLSLPIANISPTDAAEIARIINRWNH